MYGKFRALHYASLCRLPVGMFFESQQDSAVQKKFGYTQRSCQTHKKSLKRENEPELSNNL